jgi:H+-transporting ATPase
MDAVDIVPGDVLIVRLGDIVPADIKILGEEGDEGQAPMQVGPARAAVTAAAAAC